MIDNKFAIFSDLHLGIKQDSVVWHNIALEWCDWFISENKKRGIKNIVFLGDFFHSRNTISTDTLHLASQILDKLSIFNLYFILGNHDLHYANIPDVSPVNLFNGRNNIRVFSKPEILNICGKKVLFCGWGYDLSEYNADILFTHAEINTFKYNTEVEPCTGGYQPSGLLKNYKVIYSGHFHLRQEKRWGEKRVIYVGNTFSMDHSDTVFLDNGFDILDLDNLESEFVKNTISPRFYKTNLSYICDIEGDAGFNTLINNIRNNFCKLVIDKDISHDNTMTLLNLFNRYNPKDLTVEYENNKLFIENNTVAVSEVFDMVDAIKKYIEQIDIPNKEIVEDYIINLYKKAQEIS